MPDNSFDVVSKIELPEVLNAVQQALKEVQQPLYLAIHAARPGHQDAAGGQVLQAAEGRRGQVAGQAARDLALDRRVVDHAVDVVRSQDAPAPRRQTLDARL